MGYGVIESTNNSQTLITAGVVHLDKVGDTYEKLKKIHEKVTFLIQTYQPTEMAIEAPFFGKNVQSMLKLGRAQGVAISVAMTMGLQVTEYAPRKIKLSITGSGNASKEQVAALVIKYLKIETMPSYLDTTDALAVGLCHAYQHKLGVPLGGASSWEKFIKEQPGRVKK
jgi:crossover junction endodeoxyribonuclease RuvC